MRTPLALPALLCVVACGDASPPPQQTVFDTMTHQEKALPAAAERAQAAHMDELKRQEDTTAAPGH